MRPKVKLWEIISFQNWFAFKSEEYKNSWAFVMRIKNVQDWYISLEDPQYIDTKNLDLYKDFLLNPWDILMSLTWNIWRVWTIKTEHLPALLNQRVARLKIKEWVDKSFVFYFLSRKSFQEWLMNIATGAAQKNISIKDIQNIEIPLPQFETQKTIVTKLDKIFVELNLTKSEIEKNIYNTDKLLNSALNQVFQGDWEMKKLGEICENFDNQRKPVTAGDRKKWTYPYYWASWIVDYVDNYIYDWDYLLVSEDWANLLARSTPIAFSISWKNWVNNHAHVLKFWNNTTQLFVERFLNFIDLSDYVTWSAQPKLNQKNLNDIEIPVPPLSEQEKIVEYLDQVSKEVKALKSQYQSQLNNLEESKKSVLDKAFRWEIL